MADQLTSFYEQKYGGNQLGDATPISAAKWPTDRYQAVLSYFLPCKRVLDIGVGDANELRAVRCMCEVVTATEISPSRASAARDVFAGDTAVTVYVHNIEDGTGPLAGQVYDAVLMNAVVEHLVDPLHALQVIRELMAPGAYLLITTPNIAKWTRRLKLLRGRFPATASVDEGLLQYDRVTATEMYDEGHLHYFTYRSLTRVLLERAGFSRVEKLSYGLPAALAHLWPTLFSDVCLRAWA